MVSWASAWVTSTNAQLSTRTRTTRPASADGQSADKTRKQAVRVCDICQQSKLTNAVPVDFRVVGGHTAATQWVGRPKRRTVLGATGGRLAAVRRACRVRVMKPIACNSDTRTREDLGGLAAAGLVAACRIVHPNENESAAKHTGSVGPSKRETQRLSCGPSIGRVDHATVKARDRLARALGAFERGRTRDLSIVC